MGLGMMFDRISTNLHTITHGFVDGVRFPFKCEILLALNGEAHWMPDLICTGCDDSYYHFILNGKKIKELHVDIIKIVVVDEFGAVEGMQYYNDREYTEVSPQDGREGYSRV